MTYRYIYKNGDFRFTDSNGANAPRSCLVYSKYCYGSNTPNYKSLKKRELPVNSYVSYVTHQFPNTGSSTYSDYTVPTAPSFYTASETGIPISAISDGQQERAEAHTKASSAMLSALKDMKVNLAQAAAEAHQTANMFAVTARRITSSFVALRRGNFSKAVSYLGVGIKPTSFNRYKTLYEKDPFRAAANAWLELQYGWKPLLDDVYGAAETIARERGDRPLINTIRKTASVKRNHEAFSNNAGAGYTMTSSSRSAVNAMCSIAITYEVRNDALRLASSIGLTDPALLAWELLPYSFVVDWFLPVGGWLERANATSGLLFHKGSCSELVRIVSSESHQSSSFAWNFVSDSEVGGGHREDLIFERTVLGSFPANPLPQFKNPVSFGHLSNALALLTTAFKR